MKSNIKKILLTILWGTVLLAIQKGSFFLEDMNRGLSLFITFFLTITWVVFKIMGKKVISNTFLVFTGLSLIISLFYISKDLQFVKKNGVIYVVSPPSYSKMLFKGHVMTSRRLNHSYICCNNKIEPWSGIYTFVTDTTLHKTHIFTNYSEVIEVPTDSFEIVPIEGKFGNIHFIDIKKPGGLVERFDLSGFQVTKGYRVKITCLDPDNSNM